MSTFDTSDRQSQKDPAQLEREIDLQRAHVEQLINAIEQKLSPGEIFDRALGYGKDGGRQFATNLSHTVRANPVPTLLTALGMAWLYAQKDRPVERGDEDLQAAGEGLGDKASKHWASVKERAGSAAHGASDAGHRGKERVRQQYHHLLDDNPVALGAIGLAVGALIGAALPPTDLEKEYLGGMRDQLADRAREHAHKVAQPKL